MDTVAHCTANVAVVVGGGGFFGVVVVEAVVAVDVVVEAVVAAAFVLSDAVIGLAVGILHIDHVIVLLICNKYICLFSMCTTFQFLFISSPVEILQQNFGIYLFRCIFSFVLNMVLA